MGVPVQIDESFTAGTPQAMFETAVPVPAAAIGRQYDISPDGQRFLVIQPAPMGDDSSGTVSLRIVLNWFEELKERAPPL